MDEEEVYSVSESKSLFTGMKKKDSRPVYLQLKGAFLSAMSVQESDNYIINDSALLSSRQDSKNNEENSEMTVLKEEEDILAVANELSDDLSSIAADALNKEEAAPRWKVFRQGDPEETYLSRFQAEADWRRSACLSPFQMMTAMREPPACKEVPEAQSQQPVPLE
jgi:hypothetical protein